MDREEGQQRHFAGTNTKFLVDYLRDHARRGALDEVLGRAGESRSTDLLTDDATWSSYTQFRRLLEATAHVLGDPRRLADIGLNAFSNLAQPDFTAMLQALGSPAALYAEIDAAGASLATVVHLNPEEVGPTEWVISQTFDDGIEAYREYCWYSVGLMAVTPKLFGYPPAEVTEEECQCDGAPSCRFRIRWETIDEPVRRADYWQMRTQVLEGRLESFQETVADLVSGDDLEDVLARIVASAARAVRAPAYVLAIEALPSAAQRVYSDGLDPDDAQRIADELLSDGRRNDPGSLVVRVASTRRSYGRLAAIKPGRFLAQELSILEAYGRLAAAALDSAAALEESRRAATTAEALLDLSTALAEIVSADEMAANLARATLRVIDADRSMVVLNDLTTMTARIAAIHGFEPGIAASLMGRTFPMGEPDRSKGVPHQTLSTDESGSGDLLRLAGVVASASLPIVSNGEVLGAIAVGVVDRPGRLSGNPDLAARLGGLAAQAATAIGNARLLDRIRHQALHDTLTGLPNRAMIMDRAELLLAGARRDHEPIAAFFIDLDDFENVNDTLGHSVGDKLLQSVSTRVAGALRDGDTVGRLGGDEFVVLSAGGSLAAGPEMIAMRLQDAFREPFFLDDPESLPLSISASIGVATSSTCSAGELLRDADIALYRAKETGRARFVTFRSEMQADVLERHELQVDLRAGLTDQLFLVYQPIFDLARSTVTAVEALLRWRHPSRGVVGPNDFIPVLEQTGMIIDVGRWVLKEACTHIAEWRRSGRPLTVAVNVSVRQLELEGFLADVRHALQSSGLDAGALTIEVTETALMHDTEAAVRCLTALKRLGVEVAIDDFGTGYSSLAYLQQFPVDALKIDQSFVSGITSSRESVAMVRTLVQLGHNLGLATIAEGIEDGAQLALLRDEGCDSGQGFFLSPPLEAAELRRFLLDWDRICVEAAAAR